MEVRSLDIEALLRVVESQALTAPSNFEALFKGQVYLLGVDGGSYMSDIPGKEGGDTGDD